MGTTRLVLDGRDHRLPVEVGVERLGELLADRQNRLWLDISDPVPRRSRCSAGHSGVTSWHSRM
jgi:hypothetical protein